jgi:hypothetical protein
MKINVSWTVWNITDKFGYLWTIYRHVEVDNNNTIVSSVWILFCGNYEKIFEMSRNVCHLPEKSANFVEKAAIDTLKKCSNFALNCPFKKVFLWLGVIH